MQETPNTPELDQQEPLIPPHYMLYLALAGLIIAGLVFFTQREFTLIGWGGVGLALISLLAWAFMAPTQARAVLGGRTARFGGTSVVVTALVLVMLAGIYTGVRQQNWRWDLTQRDEFSLTETARQEIAKLGADPTKPPVKILAFYGISQASQRDRNIVLFDSYVSISNGKITYEIIDPDRYPALAQQYGNATPGQVKVFKVNEDGALDIENAEIVSSLTQEDLTNAVLRVSTSGDFRAYVLTVDGGLSVDETSATGLSVLKENLEANKWKVEQVSFFQLAGAEAEIELDDPAADGIVLVIPGGSDPLPDEQLKFITDYLDKGGDLVLLASFGLEGPTLATADNLSAYLWEKFGLRVNNDVVLDLSSSLQTPLGVVAVDFSVNHVITGDIARGSGMLFERTRSIEVNPTLPANVTVTELARSSADAFTRTDFTALTGTDPITKAEEDPSGPFVLAAAAENTETGSRLVVFGSQFVGINRDEGLGVLGIENMTAMLFGTVWTANFDTFVQDIPRIAAEFRAQDVPIFAQDAELRNINLLTIVLLPFGVLGIGLLVWWRGREREVAR